MVRIDRALRRLETIAGAPRTLSAEAEELERLRAAHALLRRRVETAIGEIDALLEPERGEAA